MDQIVEIINCSIVVQSSGSRSVRIRRAQAKTLSTLELRGINACKGRWSSGNHNFQNAPVIAMTLSIPSFVFGFFGSLIAALVKSQTERQAFSFGA